MTITRTLKTITIVLVLGVMGNRPSAAPSTERQSQSVDTTRTAPTDDAPSVQLEPAVRASSAPLTEVRKRLVLDW